MNTSMKMVKSLLQIFLITGFASPVFTKLDAGSSLVSRYLWRGLTLLTTIILFFAFTISSLTAQELAVATNEIVSATTDAIEEPTTPEEEKEEDKKKLSLSGSVDTYFRANLSAKNKFAADPDNYQVPNTAFANRSGFALGMINLIGSYDGEKTGVVADLVFGPRGTDAVFGSSTESSSIVNQLYVYWNVVDNITLTFGNFNTYLGYEVISPVDNFNYSTSYMFSWGPFSHSGIKADISFTDKISLMLGVFNPTDLTDFNLMNTYTFGAQLGYAVDFGSIYLNLLYGDQDGTLDEDLIAVGAESAGSTFQVDLTAGFDLSESFYLGLNTTYNTTAPGELASETSIIDATGDNIAFYGLAAYLQLATSDDLKIGLRGEYFGETNFGPGIIGAYDDGGDASIFALTASANYSLGNLTLIPEIRFDSGSEEGTFLDQDLRPSNSLASFLLAAVYSF